MVSENNNGNYALGKIYAIKSKSTPYYYVGSTAEENLSRRLCRHTSDYISFMNKTNNKGYVTSFFVIEQDDAEIVLLESYPCNNKIELKDREAYHIKSGGDNVVNKCMPNRTRQDWLNDNKEKTKGYHKKSIAKKNAMILNFSVDI